MKCAYCFGEHDTQAALELCAQRKIKAEIEEWRRDHPYQQDLGDENDCVDDGEFWREGLRETYDL